MEAAAQRKCCFVSAKRSPSPASKIPELQLVTEQDWLDAARAKLDTEGDYRRALSTIRAAGERKFVSMLRKSLAAYMQGNNGELPTDLAQ